MFLTLFRLECGSCHQPTQDHERGGGLGTNEGVARVSGVLRAGWISPYEEKHSLRRQKDKNGDSSRKSKPAELSGA